MTVNIWKEMNISFTSYIFYTSGITSITSTNVCYLISLRLDVYHSTKSQVIALAFERSTAVTRPLARFIFEIILSTLTATGTKCCILTHSTRIEETYLANFSAYLP